jgi:hypothetical protein
MAKTLTDAQVVHFRERGWLAPMRAMDAEQAAANRSLKIKGHLAMLWVVELARNPFMLDAVEDLIGPDIMVFGASIFAKGARIVRTSPGTRTTHISGSSRTRRLPPGSPSPRPRRRTAPCRCCHAPISVQTWRMRRPTLPTTCWRADDRCGSPTRAAR